MRQFLLIFFLVLSALGACKTEAASKGRPKPKAMATPEPGKKASHPNESISSSALLPASREQIWALVSKVEDWGAWNGNVTEVKAGLGLSAGALIEWIYGDKAVESTVLKVKDYEEFSFKTTASSKRAVMKWSLAAHGGKETAVTLRAEFPYNTATEIRQNLKAEIAEWLEALGREVGK